ncbi:MAG: hypothetical protein JWO79_3983 [Actinomycetia bacterium]|nr:hypothetical protein [Actinomycetes bacterium]MDQ1657893.1 hypothetical protein [Cryptosporangiaceae bacterium]
MSGDSAGKPARIGHDGPVAEQTDPLGAETGTETGTEAGSEHPAWRRRTSGEERWPASLAILVMIFLQLVLPERLSMTGRWVLPGVEVAILAVLLVANPRKVERDSVPLRLLGLLLAAVVSLANAWSVIALVAALTDGISGFDARSLLITGGNIWLTNVLVFAVWYWELDRGGPASRANGLDPDPDFLFPQMTATEIGPKDWEPRFADYFYVSFTNATAFSPTDTMPLSRWAKMAMLLQAAVSLATAALVIARAVNIFH